MEKETWSEATHHRNNAKEKEEETMSVSKHQKPFQTQEKPLFPNSVTDPRLSVPLELSKDDEDRVPYTINRYLRDYQREGITFIYNNYARSRGCVLGDDMGLGKTVQIIGFLAALLHKVGTWEDIENKRPQFLQSQMTSGQIKPRKVFLIVAPLSVLYNWKDELDTWGHFHCVVVHGLKKEEELARMNNGRTEIALTTYETLRICLDQFNKIDWDAVIVDEAHKIKNPGSQITQAMKELTCKVRIGLTGTILQNNLEELWCVMDWAVPRCLGTLGQFKSRFSDPIEQGQKHSATKRTLATGRKTVRALVKKISPWFLRRNKRIIKDQLPKKDDRVVYCSLTDFQQSIYQTVLESDDVSLLLRASEKCDCQSRRTRRNCCYKRNSEGVEVKYLYFSYLAILRKVANHVALLQSTAGTSKKQQKYVKDVCEKVFEKFPEFVERCKNEAFEALSDSMYSGKMKVLQKLLKHYQKKKDKVLIFSLSTKLLDVLESFCMAEGLDFSRLDGSTNSKQRLQIVKDFNSSAHVNLCLVSTMAGGLGLNFVGANIVVLFDPTWNPANDLQAIDRAYRIGQCRDVTVLRLISLGTVEEIIYLRQIYKQQLQSSVVGNESARRYFEAVQGVQKGELFGINNLFRLQTQGTCLTRTILEREGHVEAGVMSTSTHREEDEEREEKRESDSKVNADQTIQNREGSSPGVPGTVLDFSSGSEDEEQQLIKKKSSNQHEGNTNTSPGRMSLLQYGFNKVLQNIRGGTETELSSSEEEGSVCDEAGDDPKMEISECGAKACDTSLFSDKKHKNKESTSDGRNHQGLKRHKNQDRRGNPSPELKKVCKRKDKDPKLNRFQMCSDESEDFDLEEKTSSKKEDSPGKKKQITSKNTKYTEKIEMFTSSEDENTSAKCDVKKKKVKMNKTVSYSNLKEKNRNIDSMLGEVQEVAYTHSNQKVVGGSRAEEVISRAAIRDVFERKVYSQLPANHLLDTQESLSESPPDSPPPPPTTSTRRKVLVDHPVTFTSKSVHHGTHATILIGETPTAVCRQQLGEMSELFESSSVKEFALQIVKGSSNQRLSWLRHYYSSLNQPELASAVANSFPRPDSAQATPTLTPGESSSELTPQKPHSPPKKRRNKMEKGNRSCRKELRKLRTSSEEEEKMEKGNRSCRKELKKVRTSSEEEEKMEKGNRSCRKELRKVRTFSEEEEKMEKGNRSCRKELKKVRTSSEEEEKMEKGNRNCRKELRKVRTSSEEEEKMEKGNRRCRKELRKVRTFSEEEEKMEKGNRRCRKVLKKVRTFSEEEEKMEQEVVKSEEETWCTERACGSLGKVGGASSRAHTGSCSPGPLSHGGSTTGSKPTGPGAESSFVTDVLGELSVLNDLFKPKPKCKSTPSDSTNPTSTSRIALDPNPSSPAGQQSRGRRKDFWDIVNEGNEESINRLTDLQEVQRVFGTKRSITDRSADQSITDRSADQSISLWKTNDKFIWKK